MKHIVFAIPGDISAPTGGYIYDRHIIDGLRALGWQVDLLGLGEGFPFPSVQTLREAHAALSALPHGLPCGAQMVLGRFAPNGWRARTPLARRYPSHRRMDRCCRGHLMVLPLMARCSCAWRMGRFVPFMQAMYFWFDEKGWADAARD